MLGLETVWKKTARKKIARKKEVQRSGAKVALEGRKELIVEVAEKVRLELAAEDRDRLRVPAIELRRLRQFVDRPRGQRG